MKIMINEFLDNPVKISLTEDFGLVKTFLEHPVMGAGISWYQAYQGISKKPLGYYGIPEGSNLEILEIGANDCAYNIHYIYSLKGENLFINRDGYHVYVVKRLKD